MSPDKGTAQTLTIDNFKVTIQGERNLLEVIRKAHIELPTFCYHSELSIYGACRLCMVDVEGRGMVAACSTLPEAGMRVRTQTTQIRELRKVNIELLLASGNHDCPTCNKSGSCKLQSLAQRLGVDRVRFNAPREEKPLDCSSNGLVRDPNKCILCGDCVRVCQEIQGLGVLDFTRRGSQVTVAPAFDKAMADVECVQCGQCAAVCPTGAITVKQDLNPVHKALNTPGKTVVVQVAPAVRVALGEMFGLTDDTLIMGRTVAALRRLGFNKVYDTAFAADLTILEEAQEFLTRKTQGGVLPLYTSCCPAWVQFAEQEFADQLPHLSSCRSPQQMFGALAKETLPAELGIKREDLVLVAIMPCTAKKSEAKRPELSHEGLQDVDYVLTTQELGLMIQEAGINLSELEPEGMDQPFGLKTGGGIIFGNSGGVTEAVIRHVAGALGEASVLDEVRGSDGRRSVTLELPGTEVRIAVVHGLANARALVEDIQAGRVQYDFVEVMACPGGCAGGAGQPVALTSAARHRRRDALRRLDASMDLRLPKENTAVTKAYHDLLGEPNSAEAHRLLHTHYSLRRRIQSDGIALTDSGAGRIPVSVCVGTSCHLRGAQKLLKELLHHVEDQELGEEVEVRATFCMEGCDRGPTVRVAGHVLHRANLDAVKALVEQARKGELEPCEAGNACH
jgi:NADH-quinone oxidoreductase subunit G